MVEINIHLRGVLIDEVEALCLGLGSIERLLRLEDQGHVLVAAADLTEQFQSCLGVALLDMREPSWHALHGEAGVGDHT